MDAFTALHLYRMKDVVEKAFGNIKERLNMRRLLVSSEKELDGKNLELRRQPRHVNPRIQELCNRKLR